MPEISIIVPIYNSENYLEQCLQSIINQTFKDIEIICINDGSTDTSLDIINHFASLDNRIVVINKENSGYGSSLNLGISLAKGKYIGIVEADDFIKNNMYEDLINLAWQNDADVVKSNWYSYFTHFRGGGASFCRKNNKIRSSKSYKLTNAQTDSSLLRITPSVWSAIYKKDFLQHYNIKFLETPGASYQDVSFSFKVFALASKVMLTDEAYVMYRQDNNNSSVKRLDKVYCICDEYDELDKFLNLYPDLKEYFLEIKNINQFNSYMWNLMRIDDTFKKDFTAKFSACFKEKFDAGEISGQFFKRISKKTFMELINNQDKFCKNVKKEIFKDKIKDFRKNLISVKINKHGIDVVILGRQIIRI